MNSNDTNVYEVKLMPYRANIATYLSNGDPEIPPSTPPEVPPEEVPIGIPPSGPPEIEPEPSEQPSPQPPEVPEPPSEGRIDETF